MELGTLVEVTAGKHPKHGIEGIVRGLEFGTAYVEPVDTNTMEAIGEIFPINAGLLTTQPSRLDILRGKIKARAERHANLKPTPVLPLPRIRMFRQYVSRNRRADY